MIFPSFTAGTEEQHSLRLAGSLFPVETFCVFQFATDRQKFKIFHEFLDKFEGFLENDGALSAFYGNLAFHSLLFMDSVLDSFPQTILPKPVRKILSKRLFCSFGQEKRGSERFPDWEVLEPLFFTFQKDQKSVCFFRLLGILKT